MPKTYKPYTVWRFNADLPEPYQWPGGRARAFICHDGESLCFTCAKANAGQIRDAIIGEDRSSGWRVAGCEIQWEAEGELDRCAHCSDPIEVAYPTDEQQAEIDVVYCRRGTERELEAHQAEGRFLALSVDQYIQWLIKDANT